jgi:hypothetical protein
MKQRGTGLILMFVLMGWFAPQVPTFFSPASIPLKVSITIPAESLDLSDLDVRDQFNRPVHSIQKQHELEKLFISSLQSLFMKNLTPSALAMNELLARIWNVISGVVKNTGQKVTRYLSAGTPQKRFDFSSLAAHVFARALHISSAPSVFSFENNHQNTLSSILSSTILLR